MDDNAKNVNVDSDLLIFKLNLFKATGLNATINISIDIFFLLEMGPFVLHLLLPSSDSSRTNVFERDSNLCFVNQ